MFEVERQPGHPPEYSPFVVLAEALFLIIDILVGCRFPVASSSFQGLIVLLSAACVIWRFRAQDSICSPLPDSVEREKASELREQQASVGIGLLVRHRHKPD